MSIKETLNYDEMTDELSVTSSYDAEPVIDSNKRIRNSTNSKAIQKYQGDLVHVARFNQGDVDRLHKIGYKLLSPDPDEVRRALCYVQQNEPHLMVVHGKPFSRQRVTWQ